MDIQNTSVWDALYRLRGTHVKPTLLKALDSVSASVRRCHRQNRNRRAHGHGELFMIIHLAFSYYTHRRKFSKRGSFEAFPHIPNRYPVTARELLQTVPGEAKFFYRLL